MYLDIIVCLVLVFFPCKESTQGLTETGRKLGIGVLCLTLALSRKAAFYCLWTSDPQRMKSRRKLTLPPSQEHCKHHQTKEESMYVLPLTI